MYPSNSSTSEVIRMILLKVFLCYVVKFEASLNYMIK